MSAKQNVFPSRSERENFQNLKKQWGKLYNIYPNLPFLNVFDSNNLFDFSNFRNIHPFVISDNDINRLKKTSIDYTLCDEYDSPILCIEFDGIQDGYNVGDKYYPEKVNSKIYPWRSKITELKLRIALGSMFPYFVVGYKHFKPISKNIKLTIVDGLIGDVLTRKAIQKEISEFDTEKIGYSQNEFDQLLECEKDEILQDWVSEIEVIEEMKNNPITKKRSELEKELNTNSYSDEFFSYPSFQPGDIDGYYSRILDGRRITYHTSDLGDVEGEVWIPNFNVPYYSGTITGDIAKIFALQRIKQQRLINIKNQERLE